MIGWLAGVVRRNDAGLVILDVGGVGYQVHLASRREVAVGSSLEVHVRTAVRDDTILLYGFLEAEERDFFDQLLATPGVGPSTALAALRTMEMTQLVSAIEAGDVKTVATVPGVGAKTASRIVLELRGKVVAPLDAVAVPRDLDDALRSLGYSASEIRDALADVDIPDGEAAALRVALSRLGRS